MTCYAPLKGYLSRERSTSGKRQVVFSPSAGYVDRKVEVACGSCRGCRADHAKQWQLRCIHEASLHERNSFLTLTYNDENLPVGGTLRHSDFQKFMKRLRKYIAPQRVSYYMVGEYGGRIGRPHYHCLLFGYDFDDKKIAQRKKSYTVYRSDTLGKIWTNGFNTVGEVNAKTAGYCTKYMVDKYTNKDPEEVKKYYGGRMPPYAKMSTRPPIGKEWIRRYGAESYTFDSVIHNGKECPIPRGYDRFFRPEDPDAVRKAQRQRRRLAGDVTDDARRRKEIIHESRDKLFKRGA